MEIGQRFKSQSKVQEQPLEYIYRGIKKGLHYLEAVSGNVLDDCEVCPKWFANRKIKLIK